MVTIWVLIVITGWNGYASVWPGATDWLLGKPEASYTSYTACAKDRRELWRKRLEAKTDTVVGYDVVAARCVPVKVKP